MQRSRTSSVSSSASRNSDSTTGRSTQTDDDSTRPIVISTARVASGPTINRQVSAAAASTSAAAPSSRPGIPPAR